MNNEIITGSGNVFADLGMPNPTERLLKAQLAAQIQNFMQETGLNQTQLAVLADLTQPKVSMLLKGQLSGFSAEKLITILNRLGHSVEVRVASAITDAASAQTQVTLA